MNIEALCAAPPEALTHSPSRIPLSCPVAPQAAEVHRAAGLRAFADADTRRGTHRHDAGLRPRAPAPSPTPTRAEHHAGLQILRLRALARRRAPKGTSHVAGLQTVRLRSLARRRAPKRTSHVRLAPKRTAAASPFSVVALPYCRSHRQFRHCRSLSESANSVSAYLAHHRNRERNRSAPSAPRTFGASRFKGPQPGPRSDVLLLSGIWTSSLYPVAICSQSLRAFPPYELPAVAISSQATGRWLCCYLCFCPACP